MFSFFPRRASQFLPERSEPELRGGPIGLGGIRRSSHGEGENFWWLYQDAPLARPAGKSALRQPEALFSFTRPIGWVGSSVVEQRPFKPLVVGSNPTRPTTLADSQFPIPNRAARTHALGSRRPDFTSALPCWRLTNGPSRRKKACAKNFFRQCSMAPRLCPRPPRRRTAGADHGSCRRLRPPRFHRLVHAARRRA